MGGDLKNKSQKKEALGYGCWRWRSGGGGGDGGSDAVVGGSGDGGAAAAVADDSVEDDESVTATEIYDEGDEEVDHDEVDHDEVDDNLDEFSNLSIDATEPRLEPELSDTDTVMAAVESVGAGNDKQESSV